MVPESCRCFDRRAVRHRRSISKGAQSGIAPLQTSTNESFDLKAAALRQNPQHRGSFAELVKPVISL